ncbi:MAG TPA: flagellar hook-length control protein FliK, partial [Albitalea sp.]|nr:flagellar hook-length control protein FliK [Albitalea sp.]
VTLATPATSPEFREALGVQVSVLARDGVHRAELHLNPADMGPISVQIALDGTQAQVDFGADSLATRQIIESGLPELAAALRDAGFTLSGGGVSQHPRGGAEGGAAAGSPRAGNSRRVDGASEGSATRRQSIRVPQGAVDLYA